uniref:C-type lectin domain-containing protein n=1 Tax=Anas platyrhynchos TaxID=8839 RepID=A0A8B9R737_ANAPL
PPTPRVWGGPGLSEPCCQGSARRWDPSLPPFFFLQVFLPSARLEELRPGSYTCSAPSGKCFYFSDGEKNQTLSQADCHARGANLAVIQSKKELVRLGLFSFFVLGSHDHWIGLSRQNPRQRWEWDDGTEFDSSLGQEACRIVTSARSSGERHWICTRQDTPFPF